MKFLKLGYFFVFLFAIAFFSSCTDNQEGQSQIEARANYTLDRVYIGEVQVDIPSIFSNSSLSFFGPENGGSVRIQIGSDFVLAYINPSREHPSFESGYWHHHLYASSTQPSSPRINFLDVFPNLGIDENLDAQDNTQSNYQRGNLHYIVETGEFRLRFTIDGEIYDLIFIEV